MTVLFTDAFVKLARERSASMERERTLDPALLDYIYDNKLFKLFVPRSLGGLMLPLPDGLRIFEEAARIDGSFGWAVTIGSGGGFFSATLAPEQARALFGPRRAVVAGSGHPNGVARKAEGGYIASGRWSTCSGSTYASVFTANCRLVPEGAEPSPNDPYLSFAFLPEQVDIVRDWNALGMRATDSHTIVVKDAFVPIDRTFDIVSPPRFDDPIFRYPFLPFAQTSFAAVSLGIGRHFVEEAEALAKEKEEEWSLKKPQWLEAYRGRILQQSEALREASDEFYRVVVATWETFVRSGQLNGEEEQEVGRVSKRAAQAVLDAAHHIFPLAGMTALMEDHPINRTWRDLHTVTQHAVLARLD